MRCGHGGHQMTTPKLEKLEGNGWCSLRQVAHIFLTLSFLLWQHIIPIQYKTYAMKDHRLDHPFHILVEKLKNLVVGAL